MKFVKQPAIEVMYESETLVAQVAKNEANGNADHSCTKIRFSTSL